MSRSAPESKIRRRATVLLMLAGATCWIGVATARGQVPDPPATTVLGWLSAQREATGIPGGLIERPEWSAGCAAHMAYGNLSGDRGHDEDPSKPGYSEAGRWSGLNSVLAPVAWSDPEINPWQEAPFHLSQMLNPVLLESGYANGCLVTLGSLNRPRPAVTEILSYPGPGFVAAPSTESIELPYTPNQILGIGKLSGTIMYVYAFGPDDDWVIDSATLTGPDGAVPVLTMSATQPFVILLMSNAGLVIPTTPLRWDSDYQAHVVMKRMSDRAETVERTWSFRTFDGQPRLAVTAEALKLRIRTRSPAPVTVTLGKAIRIGQVPGADSAGTSVDREYDVTGTRGNGPLYGAQEMCVDQAKTPQRLWWMEQQSCTTVMFPAKKTAKSIPPGLHVMGSTPRRQRRRHVAKHGLMVRGTLSDGDHVLVAVRLRGRAVGSARLQVWDQKFSGRVQLSAKVRRQFRAMRPGNVKLGVVVRGGSRRQAFSVTAAY